MLLFPVLFSIALLAGILVCLEAGRRIGLARLARDKDERQPTELVDSAVAALLGLLLAFTFSGALTRFDERRRLMAEETNAIGTAYLRLDLLAPEKQASLKDKLRRYADARIGAFHSVPDLDTSKSELARSQLLQGEIWSEAIAATRVSPGILPHEVLDPINAMIDMATTQRVATETHPPQVIYGILAGLALVAALLVGCKMAEARRRDGLHLVVYAGALAIVVYLILDLEYPRFGLIRVDSGDQVLIDLRRSMK
jgi:hypothetical protein